MNILVTGSEGFIGSHLTERLVSQGYKVKCLVLYNSFNNYGWLETINKKILNDVEICFGDIRDPNFVREIVKKSDVIMHLAALIGIPYSYISPKSYVETNISGTLNILQSARDFDVEKVVHTSTSEVYGSAQKIPISENHPLNGQSPYSATKIAADQLANSFYSSYGTPVVTLRPFNTYGPRQSLRAIIPTTISQVISGVKEIKLGSLNPTRDFTYISDTVSAYLKTIKSKKIIGKTINIGAGYEISIKSLVNLILNETNKDIKVVLEKNRVRPKNSEVSRLCCSNKLAKKLLNWTPKHNGKKGLKIGIQKTIEWFSKPENIKKYKSQKFIF